MNQSNNTGFSLESLRLIGAALALQRATATAANIVPLPGTGRFVVIGTPAEVEKLMEAAPIFQSDDDAVEVREIEHDHSEGGHHD
jgi:hypothetical protein